MVDLKRIIPSETRGKIMDFLWFLPDKMYIQLFYFATTGRLVNFKNPKNYGEKLQWIKIYDRHPEQSILVDKLAVRDVVKEKLGYDCTFPVLGKWKSFSEIDFDLLPENFVLKCNHDSGSVKIIRNKSSLSKEEYEELEKFFTNRIKYDFFYAGREFPYKGIEPYIFAEKLMKPEETEGIKDYKFFCFNGTPKLLMMISGRRGDNHCEDFFDMDFNWIPEIRTAYHSSLCCPEKPVCFEQMKNYAEILSNGLRHVRMDFYEIDGKVYFGEYTFFEGGGFQLFKPDEWERRLGDWIDLESI